MEKVTTMAKARRSGASLVISVTQLLNKLEIEEGEYFQLTLEKVPNYPYKKSEVKE